jgi:sporulation integral membrane protein YtvI
LLLPFFILFKKMGMIRRKTNKDNIEHEERTMGENMEREEKIRRQREFLTGFAYWAVWIAGALLVVKYLGSVLLPFAAAFFISILLAKPVDTLAGQIKIPRKIVAVAGVALFYGVAGVLLYLLGYRMLALAYDSLLGAKAFLNGTVFPTINHAVSQIEQKLAGWDAGIAQGLGQESSMLLQQATAVAESVSENFIGKISEVAVQIPGFCLKVLFAVIATIFMELDYHKMMAFLVRQIPAEKRKMIADCKKNVFCLFGKYLLSYGIIWLITFGELLCGFWMLKVEGAFVIAFVVAVLDILPVFGTGTVLLPWCVIAFATGDTFMGGGILALYLVITVVRNIVEPKLVGHQIGLSPIVTLPCMLVGLKLFGIAGLIAAPLIAAFLKNLKVQGMI